MSTFTVTTECGTSGDVETIRDAEAGKRTHGLLCEECDEDEIHIEAAPAQSTLDDRADDARDAADRSVHDADPDTVDGDVAESDGGTPDAGGPDAPRSDAADRAPAERDALRPTNVDRDRTPIHEAMPDTVRTDPLDVVPEYMIDEVEGRPTINKRGYAVIAHHFDIVVNAEPITTAGETDHEYAEFRATAWQRGDDPEQSYTGHATARASEDRVGMADNLNEMAETRAMKRAVAWAAGVGILAWEEMAGYLDGAA